MKILAIAQSASQLRPILAETLTAFSDRSCRDILKRKKTGEVLDHFQSLIERKFENIEKNVVLKFFKR